MDLRDAAEDLYGVRPDEFVARRTELAQEARAAGEKDLAARLRKLAKPSAAAWVVNMLVRHEPEQVDQVLDLGGALREAQASMAGEQLRELGRQRRQLTAAVTRQARGLAADLGERVGEAIAAQVEGTLHAAMVDEDAARAVRTGLLVRPLTVAGAEAVDVVEAVALPETLGDAVVRRPPARTTRPRRQQDESRGKQDGEPGGRGKPRLTVVEDTTRAVEEAEAALREAEEEHAEAERRLAKAQRRVEKREARALQLQAELDELRRRVAEVEQRLEENEEGLSEAEDARDEREESVADSRRAVERARKALETLR